MYRGSEPHPDPSNLVLPALRTNKARRGRYSGGSFLSLVAPRMVCVERRGIPFFAARAVLLKVREAGCRIPATQELDIRWLGDLAGQKGGALSW